MLHPVSRSGLQLLLGAFALLGLFAMHGLGDHGARHGVADQPVSVAAAASPVAVGGTATRACGGHCASPEPGSSTGDSGHGVGPALMLCLAVLIAVAAAVVTMSPPLGWSIRRATAAATAVRAPRSARDRDPPSLLVLSIQRC